MEAALPGARFVSVEQLGAQLEATSTRLLVLPYGSAFPEAAWEQCLSRFVLTEEAVMTDAENLGIDASIIAGRIRKERNNYTLLTRLVGQDAVVLDLIVRITGSHYQRLFAPVIGRMKPPSR